MATPTDGSGTSPSPTVPEGAPSPEFGHARLKGRSAEEVDNLYGITESTVREQGATINQLQRELAESKKSVAPPVTTEAKATAQDFYADPVGVMERALDKQIEPLREEIASAKRDLAPDVRVTLATKYSDWADIEPYIDQLLAKQGQSGSNDHGLLESYYLMAKGYMVTHGVTTAEPVPADPNTVVQPGNLPPPQHRASSPPAPPRTEQQGAPLRDLTENEERLRREYKMTKDDFIAWQDLDDPAEVPVSRIGMPPEEKK